MNKSFVKAQEMMQRFANTQEDETRMAYLSIAISHIKDIEIRMKKGER